MASAPGPGETPGTGRTGRRSPPPATPDQTEATDAVCNSPVWIEVLSLEELRHRLSPASMAATHRLDFHQITLITGGRGVVRHRRPRGRPGKPLHLARPAGLGVDGWQLEEPSRHRIGSLLDALADEYGQSSAHDDSPALLRHLLAALLIHVARLPRPPTLEPAADGGRTGFARFLDELERDFTRSRSVRDSAARLGYFPRTLTRMSLQATGKSAKAVIDGRVSLEAMRLLAHTDRPVAAIADDLGFSEPTNFVKFFTALAGTTPGAFREAEGHVVTG